MAQTLVAITNKPGGGKPDKVIRDSLLAAMRQSPDKLKQGSEKLVDRYAEGDLEVAKFMADRIDGKAIQTLASDPENPIVPGANLAKALLESIPTEQLAAILTERADDNALGH